MGKIYCALTWTNHVEVTKAGGKKVIRDEHYSEPTSTDLLLSKVLGRVRKVSGGKGFDVDSAYNNFHADVKQMVDNNCTVKRTVKYQGRKLFTYEIRPLKIQWSENGAEYMIKDGKGIVHIGGARPYTSSSGKRYSGLSVAEREALGIPNVQHDHDTMMSEIEKRANEIELERLTGGAPASPMPKGKETKPNGKGRQGGKQPRKQDSKKPKDVAKKQVDKPSTDKVESKETVKRTPSGKQWSKRVLNECEKWGVDPELPPTNKPKGMNNKIWKQVSKQN